MSSITPFSFVLPIWALILFAFLSSFVISYISIPTINKIAHLKNLCAVPNNRTMHFSAIPTLGGVAIFIGFIISSVFIAGTTFGFEFNYIFAGAIILFFLGIKDDLLVISPYHKLIGQIISAIMVSVLADIRIEHLYEFLNIETIPYFVSIVFTVFAFLVIINGFNLIDGIDGLSSGVGIFTASIYGLWFWSNNIISYAVLSFSIAGALLAFFRFNVFGKKNKIFLGDTGSLITGFVVAVLTVKFLQLESKMINEEYIQASPAIAFSILIIPLFDTLRIFAIRIKQGRSPFVADKQHIHHRLVRLGLSHFQATSVILTVNLAMVIFCFFFQRRGNIRLIITIFSVTFILSKILVYADDKKKNRNILDQQSTQVEGQL